MEEMAHTLPLWLLKICCIWNVSAHCQPQWVDTASTWLLSQLKVHPAGGFLHRTVKHNNMCKSRVPILKDPLVASGVPVLGQLFRTPTLLRVSAKALPHAYTCASRG